MAAVPQVLLKTSFKAWCKEDEGEADRKRNGKTESQNRQLQNCGRLLRSESIGGDLLMGLVKNYTEEEIKLQFCYPRLDINVSKGINHLLKSPFCIHPKSGRVCVPMDPKNIDDFDPMTVPTISGLIEELDTSTVTETDSDGKRLKDYKRTSLRPYIEIFEQFLKGLESSRKGKLIEQSDIKMEF
ncbi:DNA primase [Plakobranchus ocellatus]|uniref:DNA primase n=1 Tax=Plakobranchus ocellatus TaxID=259542 RepID=A0AAV4CBL0_9GAST|nr:DNA primase [Plakobranchus ocellatus]